MKWFFGHLGRVLLVTEIVILIAVVACVASPVHTAPSADKIPAVTPGNVEVGNMTYIPVNRVGDLEANIELVFVAVQTWEDQHRDREVVSISPVHQQRAYATSSYTFGVIIYSRSKK